MRRGGWAERTVVCVELDGEMRFDLRTAVETEPDEENMLKAALRETIGEPGPEEDLEKAVGLALRCVSVSIDGVSEPILPSHRLQAARLFYHMAHAHPDHWERLCNALPR